MCDCVQWKCADVQKHASKKLIFVIRYAYTSRSWRLTHIANDFLRRGLNVFAVRMRIFSFILGQVLMTSWTWMKEVSTTFARSTQWKQSDAWIIWDRTVFCATWHWLQMTHEYRLTELFLPQRVLTSKLCSQVCWATRISPQTPSAPSSFHSRMYGFSSECCQVSFRCNDGENLAGSLLARDWSNSSGATCRVHLHLTVCDWRKQRSGMPRKKKQTKTKG